ncbi:MAG: hypothetical protein WCL32_11905 [Planctomycetota bacterium]|jgi:hypothetical protein
MLKKSLYASAVLIATLLIPAALPEQADAYYYRAPGFYRSGFYRPIGYGYRPYGYYRYYR